MKRYRAIAEYYDAENEHYGMLQEDVPLLLQHLPKRRQSVLELATGTGRAAIPLAQAGHAVTGVDYAADMLQIAQRKKQSAGLTNRQLRLLKADVLGLDLGRRFDWVVLLYNTFLAFTTLAQQDRLLQAVRRHLRPHGRFWLDIFQPNLALLAEPLSLGLDPCAFYVPRYDRTVAKTTDVQRDPACQAQHVTFRYTWFDAAGLEHREKVAFDITFIFPRELQILLERNGLEIERLYGNYDRSPLCAESPRMIACCRLG